MKLCSGLVMALVSMTASAELITINFDVLPDSSSISAPSEFSSAAMLGEEYASQGIHFEVGNIVRDGVATMVTGGSILPGSSFGVTARSGDNVYGFNSDITDNSQTIHFDTSIGFFEIYATRSINTRVNSRFTVDAFDSYGSRVAANIFAPSDSQQRLYIESAANDITKILLGVDRNEAYFFDDLTFGVQSTEVPVPAGVILFGSALVGLLGLKKRHRIAGIFS